jgi:cytochrome c5
MIYYPRPSGKNPRPGIPAALLAAILFFAAPAALQADPSAGVAVSKMGRMTAQRMGKGMERGKHGKGMRKRMMEARVPGVAPDQLPDPDSAGAALVIRYCSQCHNIPSPATHSKKEWVEVVNRMERHMEMMEGRGHRKMRRITRPTPEEKTNLLAYLQAHALKPFASGPLPDPESPGALLFRKFCVQCHLLPDPNLHTAAEWPGVVERMRMNMRVINKPVITDPERDGIVEYLQKVTKK